MVKLFYILLFFSAFSKILIGSVQENAKLFVPRFIPAGSGFEISLHTSANQQNADILEIYIISDDKITLSKADLRSINTIKRLNFTTASLEGYSEKVLRAVIDLEDTIFAPGAFFQVLASFKAENVQSAVFKIKGVFKKGSDTVGSLIFKDHQGDRTDMPVYTVNFYKPQKTSGKAIQLDKNSIFEFTFTGNSHSKILTEFWLKASPSSSVMRIRNASSGNVEYDLNINQFQMLSVSSRTNEHSFIQPWFISTKAWYHISVVLSFTDNMVYFYCNGNLICQSRATSITYPSEVRFEFLPAAEERTMWIDLLRIVELRNSVDISFRNRSHQFFRSDSSTVLASFSFDNSNGFNSSQGSLKVKSERIQYIKSDAPIFARAPELNVSVNANSYEISWKGGDYRQTANYILERSIDNSEFISVYVVSANNTSEQTYTFTDVRTFRADIVYYRVKQVHHDGTSIYSSQVKIGQGETAPFELGQNFPNPFNPATSIEISILEDTEIEILIYNLEGKEIVKLHSGFLSKGTYKFSFDGAELPSGVYLYKVSSPNYSQIKKMILTK